MGTAGNGNGNGHKAPPHAWKPGQSGNPGGRPKADARLREAIQLRSEEMLATLFALAGLGERGKDGMPIGAAAKDSDQLTALGMLFDRGFGRPAQAITGPDGAPLFQVQPTDIAEALEQVKSRGLPAPVQVN